MNENKIYVIDKPTEGVWEKIAEENVVQSVMKYEGSVTDT